jgi:hypothetical protein
VFTLLDFVLPLVLAIEIGRKTAPKTSAAATATTAS